METSTCHKTIFPPPMHFHKAAKVQDESLYLRAKQNPIEFWEECASKLSWFRNWDTPFQGSFVHPEWFVGGKINASYNCIDKHLLTETRDKIAIYWEGENSESKSFTYLEMYREVNRFANILKMLDVKKGDRIAIFLPLIPETIFAMLACSRIGAIHTVIFGGIGVDGVRDRLNHSEATLLITADGSYRKRKIIPLKEIADEAIKGTLIKRTLLVERLGLPITKGSETEYLYRELKEKVSIHCPAEPMDSEDPLFILYTSGSTGKPKGIFHSTGGYLTGVYASFDWVFDIRPNDVYWCTADPGWITGHSFVVYAPFMHGSTQVIYEGAFDCPDSGRVWHMIEKYKVSIFYTAPTAIRTFIKWGTSWPRKYNLSSLRLLGSIGEPINPDVWMWYHKEIGEERCPIVDTWFQTETGGLMIAPLPGVTALKPGSITKPLPGIKAAVLDAEGNPASTGSLALLSPIPSMMRGCYKDEDRYLATYWSKWEGKYYYTGDAAVQDKDGYIWVTGRQDEILKVSGHRIGTAEVESALVDHPAVAEAAVIGVSDPITGEQIHAFVTMKDKELFQKQLMEEDLKSLTAKKIGSYAKPQKIYFVPDLPKTRSGKIMRRILKNICENSPLGDTSTLENPQITDVLQNLLNEPLESNIGQTLESSNSPLLASRHN